LNKKNNINEIFNETNNFIQSQDDFELKYDFTVKSYTDDNISNNKYFNYSQKLVKVFGGGSNFTIFFIIFILFQKSYFYNLC